MCLHQAFLHDIINKWKREGTTVQKKTDPHSFNAMGHQMPRSASRLCYYKMAAITRKLVEEHLASVLTKDELSLLC